MTKILRLHFITIWAAMLLGLLAFVSSCSYEMPEVEVTPEPEEVVEPELCTVKLSMVLPSTMGSRAGSGENANISRYILEVYEKSSNEPCVTEVTTDGDFDLDLDPKKSYMVYGWADEGDVSAYDYNETSGGLGYIKLKENRRPTIAHQGMSMIDGSDVEKGLFLLKMQHAVAKVVLRTTTPLTANSAKLEVLTHPMHSAIKQKGMDMQVFVNTIGPAADITEASEESPVDVTELYVLANVQEATNINLQYTLTPGDFHDPYTKTITNVAIGADRRTVLVGDIAGMRSTKLKIKFSLDTDWDGDDVPIPDDEPSTDPNNPDNPTVPDDPANSYAVITLDGKTADAVVSEVNAAVGEGKVNIRLTGSVFEGLFGAQKPFGSGNYTNIDLSQTTNWSVIGNTLPEQTFAMAKVDHVYLPAEVTVLGDKAFLMSYITSIQLPGVTELREGCFQGCSKLVEIDAPKVIDVQGNALDCSALKTLKLTSGNVDLDENAMGNVSESGVGGTSPKWNDCTWKSITLVNDDGSINRVIQ